MDSGYVYVLHFARPVGNLSNPRGQAADPEARERQHRAGQGAALTRAAVAQGVTWELFILGPGDRTLERRVKALKATPRLCPVCGRQHPGGRLHLPGTAVQLALLPEPDPFDLPAPPATGPDWLEISYLRTRERVCRFPQPEGAESFGVPY